MNDDDGKIESNKTARALRMQNQARRERSIASTKRFHDGHFERREASRLEGEAVTLLTVDVAPDIISGEALPNWQRGETAKKLILRDTLTGSSQIANDASINRTELLLKENFNIAAMAVDAAETVSATLLIPPPLKTPQSTSNKLNKYSI